MVTNIDENLPKYNTTAFIATGIIALALTSIFSLTACSTFISAQKNESDQYTPSIKATAAIDPAAGNTGAFDKSYDKNIDEWEKARAAYLRDLDYAEVFQQNNDHDEYLLKSDLIESRYHIKTAETAMNVEKNSPKALKELQLAEKRFNQAIQLANPDESKELKATKPNLDNLLKTARLSMEHSCAYPQSSRYQKIAATIENLLIAL